MVSGPEKNKSIDRLRRALEGADAVENLYSTSSLNRLAVSDSSHRDSLTALLPEWILSSDDYIRATMAEVEKNEIERMVSKEAFREEISQLRRKVSDALSELKDAKQKGNQYNEQVNALEALVSELKTKEDLGFLLTRVNSKAQEKLIKDQNFRGVFAEDRDCKAFVMSVDIRRSTELMLKARTPSLFAEFISRLTRELYRCVVENNGVFDKFTGDGVLAFFPESFSGEDYGYSVVKAAHECHKVFEKIYRESRSSFTSVLNGVGLGIGIDFGTVRLLRVAEGLTVVGVPVVYACRLSGANPGKTLLNQPAYELINKDYGKNLLLNETSINIKHEGEIIAYEVSLGHNEYAPRPPEWETRKADS